MESNEENRFATFGASACSIGRAALKKFFADMGTFGGQKILFKNTSNAIHYFKRLRSGNPETRVLTVAVGAEAPRGARLCGKAVVVCVSTAEPSTAMSPMDGMTASLLSTSPRERMPARAAATTLAPAAVFLSWPL
jgi:hypothetical protein